MRRNLLKPHLLAGLLLAHSLHAADEALIEFIPADAIAVAHVKDASQLPQRLEGSMLGKVWQDAKFQRFIAPGLKSLDEEVLSDNEVEAAIKAIRGAVETFEGEAVVSLVRMPFEAIMEDAEAGGDAEDPAVKSRRAAAMKKDLRVVALGKVAADGKAFTEQCRSITEMLIESIEGDDKGELVSETVDGLELHTLRMTHPKIEDPFDTLTYAHAGGVGILGMPREAVEEMLASIRDGLKGEKLSSGSFGAFRQKNPGHDIHLHLNLEPLIEVALSAAEKAEESGMLGPEVAGMGITVQSIHDALGLADLQSVDMGLQLDPEATAVDSAIQYTKRSGLMNLIAYTAGAMPKASFVPHDAGGASISLVSLADFWNSAMAMVEKAAPGVAPMVKQQIGAAEAQLGISLEKDLFGNLKPEILTIQSTGLGEEGVPEDDMVLMFGLKNEQGFEVAVGKVLAMVSGMTGFAFEPSEFLGRKLYSFEMPSLEPGASPGKISYLFAEGYFMISVGKGETFRKVLSGMERPGKSLWDEAHVKAAIDRLEPGYCELNYMDLGALVSSMGEMFHEMMGEEEGFLDWDNMLTTQEWKTLFGFLLSSVYVEKNGMFSRALLLSNGE